MKVWISFAFCLCIIVACVKQEQENCSISSGEYTATSVRKGVIEGAYFLPPSRRFDLKSIEIKVQLCSPVGEIYPKNFNAKIIKGNTFSAQINGLRPSTKYQYSVCMHLAYPNQNVVSEINYFTTPDMHYQGVDLGLSVEWASCNLGAESPLENGDYYAWGNIEANEFYDHFYATYAAPEYWQNYRLCNGVANTYTKYCQDPKKGVVDNLTYLEFEDDAAYVQTKGEWRIPTHEEWEELIENCSWEFDEKNNCFNIARNGKFISLPSNDQHLYNKGCGSGRYWANELYSYSHLFVNILPADEAYHMSAFYSVTTKELHCNVGGHWRGFAGGIRPVRNK